MEAIKKKSDGLLELLPRPYEDDRGFLARIYSEREFRERGFPTVWKEISHHHTAKKNILRGLYIQDPPYAEGKLLRVIRGEMLWVSVDVRRESETFGQWDSLVLSEEKKNLLLAVPGFAHGCLSLTDSVDLIILSDNYYSAGYGAGIAWNDPELGIDWGLNGTTPIISERDKNNPSLRAFLLRAHKEQWT